MNVLIGIFVGVALVVAAHLVQRWQHRPRPRPEACALCAIDDPLTGGPPISGRQVHEVIHVGDGDTEAEARSIGGGGGTFTALAYCSKHCPGGCQNPRCRRRSLVA